ncbi:MAG: hypothetical protein AAF899_13005 [Pseudomonadota bacterium]
MITLRMATLACLLSGCALIPSQNTREAGLASTALPAPETRALDSRSAKALRIARPVVLRSMTISDLIDTGDEALRVRRFGNGYRVREANGCVWTRIPDWFAPSDSWAACGDSANWHTASARVEVLDPLFPLEIGATGRYRRAATSFTGKTSTRTTDCTVTGAVTLTTPGGRTTPALVATCSDGRIVRTTWYAPDLGPVAYREVHDRRGPRQAWVRLD